MKIIISLDDVFTDEDWSRTVSEVVREEITTAVRREVKIMVKERIAAKRATIMAKADAEIKALR